MEKSVPLVVFTPWYLFRNIKNFFQKDAEDIAKSSEDIAKRSEEFVRRSEEFAKRWEELPKEMPSYFN